MKVMIPEIGDRLTLTKDWTFPLYREGRNASLRLWLLGVQPEERRGGTCEDHRKWVNTADEVTLQAGVVLKVDRVYIRQGAADFSSVSFFVDSAPGGIPDLHYESSRWGFGPLRKPEKVRGIRFWAKLADCNRIEFEPVAPVEKKPKVKTRVIHEDAHGLLISINGVIFRPVPTKDAVRWAGMYPSAKKLATSTEFKIGDAVEYDKPCRYDSTVRVWIGGHSEWWCRHEFLDTRGLRRSGYDAAGKRVPSVQYWSPLNPLDKHF